MEEGKIRHQRTVFAKVDLAWLNLAWLGLAGLHVGRCLEYRVRRHVADTNGGPEYQGVPSLSTASFRGLQP